MSASTKLVSWLASSAARAGVVAAIALSLSREARSQVITYEGTSFPEEVGWSRDEWTFPADRQLDHGWFVQTPDVVGPGPPEIDEGESYRRSIARYSDADKLYFEWRIGTDGMRECIPAVAPAAFVVGGRMGIRYHFTIARDRVRLIDSDLSVLYLDVTAGIPHTYRLELRSDATYVWFIDGEAVDSGPAPQPYPTSDSVVVFGAAACIETITASWDYIRVGEIPDDASGDYDSDEAVTLVDHYFVLDCLTKDGPGIFGGPGEDAGPGCRFADFDADSDTDLLDFAEFQNGFGLQR